MAAETKKTKNRSILRTGRHDKLPMLYDQTATGLLMKQRKMVMGKLSNKNWIFCIGGRTP
jgi:hypothetical protein